MTQIITNRFTITHVHCERNEDRGFAGRDVFIAFYRDRDMPIPACTITLWGNYVEWMEVPEECRRDGVATEVVQAIEAEEGVLSMEGVTEEGEGFVEFYENCRGSDSCPCG